MKVIINKNYSIVIDYDNTLFVGLILQITIQCT